jgi:hypothetical protein
VVAGAERLGGQCGQIQPGAARLVEVDLLEADDVGVQGGHRGPEPVGVHQAVVEGPAVEHVEGRQAHPPTLDRVQTRRLPCTYCDVCIHWVHGRRT